jgi:hypothetical protein
MKKTIAIVLIALMVLSMSVLAKKPKPTDLCDKYHGSQKELCEEMKEYFDEKIEETCSCECEEITENYYTSNTYKEGGISRSDLGRLLYDDKNYFFNDENKGSVKQLELSINDRLSDVWKYLYKLNDDIRNTLHRIWKNGG